MPAAFTAAHVPQIVAMMRVAIGSGARLGEATRFFEAAEVVPGWPDLLMTLINAPAGGPGDDTEDLRLFACTRIGAFASRRWRGLPTEARAALHAPLVSASLTCPARCARRLLAVLGDVARIDYPARWPALLSAGLLSAASSQAHAMGGAVAADADAGADAAVAAAGERLCRVLLALHSVLKGTAASKTPRCVQAHRQAVAETLPVVTALWQEHAAALSGRLASIVDAVRSSAAGAAAGPAGDQLSRAGAVVAPVPAVSAAAALAPLAPAMRRFRLCCKCLRRCILAGEASALVPGPSGGHVWPASTSGSGRPLSDVGAGSSWEPEGHNDLAETRGMAAIAPTAWGSEGWAGVLDLAPDKDSSSERLGKFIHVGPNSAAPTPQQVHHGLTALTEDQRKELQPAKWIVLYADERCVPLEDDDSNFKGTLAPLEDLGVARSQMVAIDVSVGDAPAQAADYEARMLTALGATSAAASPPSIDLVLLGMGPDGHTASLFPGHALLSETTRLIASITDSPKPPPQRITMTLPLINAARQVAFTACGTSKADAIAAMAGAVSSVAADGALQDAGPLPAARVAPTSGRLTWFIDTAAASKLQK
ncbi:PGLS [Symbiodinium sp. KB8]|nr:PGLS [Symbiodinium sp. KB8]